MAAKKVTYSLKIDPTLKDAATVLFESMGLSLETGITMFLKSMVDDSKLPFEPKANGSLNGGLKELSEANLDELETFDNVTD